MGQNLFAPPNVKGWRGGESWIDSNTLLARKQFVAQFARYDETRAMTSAAASPGASGEPRRAPAAMEDASAVDADDDAKARARRAARAIDRAFRELGFSATRWVASLPGATPAEKRREAQRLLLAIPPAGSGIGQIDESDPLAFLRATLLDPVYQLK
jgi:hypothetical protein